MADQKLDEARRLIGAARLDDPESLDVIGGTLRFTAAGEWASRESLANATDTSVLWAALWAYGSSGIDGEPVRLLLTHDSASIRAMAAAILVSLGDEGGLPAPRQALEDDGQLLWVGAADQHPPLRAPDTPRLRGRGRGTGRAAGRRGA